MKLHKLWPTDFLHISHVELCLHDNLSCGKFLHMTDFSPQARLVVPLTNIRCVFHVPSLKILIYIYTCVSAFREIHQCFHCKIFQYTFLRQYPMKFQYFFLVCKNYQRVWRQLDYRKLGLWETRLLRPLCHKTEKSCFHVWYPDLKNMYKCIYWFFYISRLTSKFVFQFTNF